MASTKKDKKKNKHQRNPVLDWLGYAAMRVALFILYLFPVRWNLRFACFLGTLMWKHYHRGRIRALNNLRESFPDKDHTWIEATGLRSFQQIVMLLSFMPPIKDYTDQIPIDNYLMSACSSQLRIKDHRQYVCN